MHDEISSRGALSVRRSLNHRSVCAFAGALVLAAAPTFFGMPAAEAQTISAVTKAPVAATALPTLHALCVGAGTFGDRRLQPIAQAANDARAVAAALLAQRGRGLYGSVDVHVVTGKDATRAAVQKEVEYLRSHVQPGDVTVVYLCGYQTADDDARARFMTSDIVVENMEKTAPLLSDVHQMLLDFPASHALVLLDLNHGDPLAPPAPAGKTGRNVTRKRARAYDPGLTTSDLPKTVRMLFSATGQEAAVDTIPGRKPAVGAFAATVADALSATIVAGPNPISVTATDLCRAVQAKVSQISNGRQHPYIPFLSDPFDDFPIAGTAPMAAATAKPRLEPR